MIHRRASAGALDKRRTSRLEIATGSVIIRLRAGTAIGDIELFRGQRRADIATIGIAIATIEGAEFALGHKAFAISGKYGCRRIDDDGAADTVATQADGRDAGEHLDAADLAGIDIRHRRVHVIAAGRDQVHAIHLDAQPVIGHAVNHGQAGNAAGAVEADAGHVTQQAGGVAGRGAHWGQAVGGD